MCRRLLNFLIVAMSSFAINIAAQQPTPKEKDEVIRIDTQLVDVPVAVVNASGLPVRGLKATDFVVYEDGKRQEITDFSTAAEPFEVALLLDTSGSTRGDLRLIQRAAADFIAFLRPGDRVAIIAFRTQRDTDRAYSVADLISPLTDDRKRLSSALESVQTSNSTPFYDSMLEVAEKVFKEKPGEEFRGRRAMVALTDGVDSMSDANFETAKEVLEQIGLVSYFIKVDTRDFFESNLLGDCEVSTRFSVAQIRRYYRSIASSRSMERKSDFCQLGDFEKLAVSKRLYEIADHEMRELAKRSGGRVFPVDSLNEARQAFRSVADDIGTKYSIGYYSTNEKRDGTYRKITVEVKGVASGTQIRAREGYNAPAN